MAGQILAGVSPDGGAPQDGIVPPDGIVPSDWIVPQWPVPARVRAYATTRAGGVSQGEHAGFNVGDAVKDDAACVATNRARLRALLPGEPCWLRQVHGTRTVSADDLALPPEADASTARKLGTVCAVMVADCMPILMCDMAGSVVGVAHAGWRGLSSGVVENAVRDMGALGDQILAYLGPAIGPRAFEVGDDVRAAFLAHDREAAHGFTLTSKNKWLADLHVLARQRLAHCGVHRVYGTTMCTYNDPARFYSYRRDGTTGRMAALIWMESDTR